MRKFDDLYSHLRRLKEIADHQGLTLDQLLHDLCADTEFDARPGGRKILEPSRNLSGPLRKPD